MVLDARISNIQKMHYKEVSPEETIGNILNILGKMELSVDEEWFGKGKVGTPSLRVTFAGTKLGQNGKGVNDKFARASAYAELMERYATGIINNTKLNTDSKFNFSLEYDEKFLTAEDLISQEDPYLNHYYEIRGMGDSSFEEKVEHFKDVNTIDYMATGKENSYLSIPFYDTSSERTIYLPYNVILFNYGSNGMSAGNTPAEAIVQSLSEIYERHVQYRILTENLTLPTVPDSYIMKFPYVYDMYKKLQSVEGYSAIMKDCSLGGKYPVAGLLLIEKNTGRYGFKLGCHPDFGVAMERAFTEAAQGRDILEYSTMSTIDFFNNGVSSDYNIENSYSVGKAQYPFEIFSDNTSDGFMPVEDVSDLNNEEILKRWLIKIKNDGNDVLIRDYSFLGFPVYHIIIPGISETVRLDDSKTRIYNTRTYLIRSLLKPDEMDAQDLQYVVSILIQSSKYVIMNEVRNLFPLVKHKLPYEDFSYASSIYLAAQCCIQAGNISKALEFMKQAKELVNMIADVNDPDQKELANRITAEFIYLTSLARLGNHKKALNYLRSIFDEKYCDYVFELYKDPKKLLSKQYSTDNNKDITVRDISVTEVMEKRKKMQIIAKIDQTTIGRYLVRILNN